MWKDRCLERAVENLEVVHSFHSSQCVLKHVSSITARVSSGQSLSCIQHFQPFLAIIEITFSDWILGGGGESSGGSHYTSSNWLCWLNMAAKYSGLVFGTFMSWNHHHQDDDVLGASFLPPPLSPMFNWPLLFKTGCARTAMLWPTQLIMGLFSSILSVGAFSYIAASPGWHFIFRYISAAAGIPPSLNRDLSPRYRSTSEAGTL